MYFYSFAKAEKTALKYSEDGSIVPQDLKEKSFLSSHRRHFERLQLRGTDL